MGPILSSRRFNNNKNGEKKEIEQLAIILCYSRTLELKKEDCDREKGDERAVQEVNKHVLFVFLFCFLTML